MIGLQGKRIWAVCAVAILAGLWAPVASADAIYGTFTGYVTGGYDVYDEYGNKIEQYYDNAFLAALGQQLGVHVYAPADGTEATFTFVNWPATYSGAIPAVITEIWWESVVPPLVDYDTADLPDNWHEAATGTVPSNVFVVAYDAEANKPQPVNGIDLWEYAQFTFDLNTAGGVYVQPGALMDALLDESFQLAIHVQGLPYGGSLTLTPDFELVPDDPFNPPPPPVPVPAAAGLGFLGMGLVGLLKGYRRIRR